jgi:prepilin-type N-terminal cleavage/methylation domain-containing protein
MRRNLVINPEEQHPCRNLAAPTPIRGKMNIQSSNIQGQSDGEREDKGFTLIEILIAIVLVGILSAVAVVGISNLVSKGTSSACGASADSARAASAVYFASNGSYPTTLTAMTTPVAGAALTLPSGVTVNAAVVPAPTAPATTPPAAAIGMQATSGSWWMNMTAGASATTAPTFACL